MDKDINLYEKFIRDGNNFYNLNTIAKVEESYIGSGKYPKRHEWDYSIKFYNFKNELLFDVEINDFYLDEDYYLRKEKGLDMVLGAFLYLYEQFINNNEKIFSTSIKYDLYKNKQKTINICEDCYKELI